MVSKISSNNSLVIYRIPETVSDPALSIDEASASHHCEELQPLPVMRDRLKEQWTGFKECLWTIISHLNDDTKIFELFAELPEHGTFEELKEARKSLFSILNESSLDDSVLNALQGLLKKPHCLGFSLINLPILKRAFALEIEQLKEKSPPFPLEPLCEELLELSADSLFSVLILMHTAIEVQDSKERIKILLEKAQDIYKTAQQMDSPQLFDIKLSLLRFPNFDDLKLGEHGIKPILFKNFLKDIPNWGSVNLPHVQVFFHLFVGNLDNIDDLKKRNDIFETCLRLANESDLTTIIAALIIRFTDPYFKFCALQSYLQFFRYLSTKEAFDPSLNAGIESEFESMNEDLLSEAIDAACQSPSTKERDWKLLQLASRLFHVSPSGTPFELSAAPSEDFDWSDLRVREAWLSGLSLSTHDCIGDLENITPRLELIFNRLSNKKLAHFCRQYKTLVNCKGKYPNPPECDLAEDPMVDLLARLSFYQLDKHEDEEFKEHLALFKAYKVTDEGFDIFLTALVETSWDCAIDRRSTLIETVNKKLALERDANLISKTILNLIHIANSDDSEWWPDEAHNALNNQALELAALLEEDERSKMTDLIYQKSILLQRPRKSNVMIARKALARNDYKTALEIYRQSREASTAILKLILSKLFEELPNLPDLEVYQIVCAIADEMHRELNLNRVLLEQGMQLAFSIRDPALQSRALMRLIIRACIGGQTLSSDPPSYFIKLAERLPDLSIRETLMKRLAHFFVREEGPSEWTKGFSLGFLSELFMKHPAMLFPLIKEHLDEMDSISSEENFWILFAETAYELKDDAAISSFFGRLSLEKNCALLHRCLLSKKIKWQNVADQALKEPIKDSNLYFWTAVISLAYRDQAHHYLAQIADQLHQKRHPFIANSFLEYAAVNRDKKSIKALVNSGVDINIRFGVSDKNILDIALTSYPDPGIDFIIFLLFMGVTPRKETFLWERAQPLFPLLLPSLENHSLESREALLTPALAMLAERPLNDDKKTLCRLLIEHGANINYLNSACIDDRGTLLYRGLAHEHVLSVRFLTNAIELGVDPHISYDGAPDLLELIYRRLLSPTKEFLQMLDQLIDYKKFEVNTATAVHGTFITLLDLFYHFRAKIPEALIAKLEARHGFTFPAYREILAAETAEIPVESPYYPILEQLKACRAHLGWKEGDPIDCPLNMLSKGVIAVEQVGEIDIMHPRSKPRSKYEYISWFIQGLVQLQKYQRVLWASNNQQGILNNPTSDYGHKISGLLLHFESGTTGDAGYSVKEGYHILLKAYQMTLEANFPDGVLSFFEYAFNSYNPCLQARVEKLNEYIDSFHNEFVLTIDDRAPSPQRLITYGRHLQYNAIRTVALAHDVPYLRLKQWLLDHESGMLEIEKDLRLTDEQKKERLAFYHEYRSHFTLEKLKQLIVAKGEDPALLKSPEAFCILTNFNLLPAL